MITYMQAISGGFPSVQCHAAGDGSVYEDIIWDAGAALPSKDTLDAWIAANPILQSSRITCLSFRNRFTTLEKIMLDMASLDTPTADMSVRQQAATLRVYLRDIDNATYIDLMRTDTRIGVQTLEAVGLIAAGRATVILDTPPTEAELYKLW